MLFLHGLVCAQHEAIDEGNLVLVGFRKETMDEERQNIHQQGGRRRICAIPKLNVDIVQPASGETPVQAIAAYQAMPEVAYAERNYRATLDAVPNDQHFGSQAYFSDPVSGIGVTSVWDYFTCATGIVVAVVDTGVNYNHPDLAPNIWINPSATGHIHGYSAVAGLDPGDDRRGHGTPVAGVIGAVGNNGIGVAGVCWRASIMVVKTDNANNELLLTNLAKSILWAVENGARIINASWTFPSDSVTLRTTIDYALSKEVLVVAAAGNGRHNLDTDPVYPAAYDHPNIIAVAGYNSEVSLNNQSNHGVKTVHLAAPWSAFSASRNGGYNNSFSGTSIAAPHVAGAAALLWAAKPEASMAEIRQAILDGVARAPYWDNFVSSGGRLNVQGVLDILFKPQLPPIAAPDIPAAITSFRLLAPGSVEFTADFAPPAGVRHRYDVLSATSLQAPTWTTNLTVDILWPTNITFQTSIDPGSPRGFFKLTPRAE